MLINPVLLYRRSVPNNPFSSEFNNYTESIQLLPDGRMIVGGSFTTCNGVSANRIIRLNSDGSIDTSFAIGTGFDSVGVSDIRLQLDGKIMVGGYYTTYNGVSANRIVRLNSDGSIDTSFAIGTGFSNEVRSLAIQHDGKLLIVGSFTTYNGVSANRIIRLNSDGSIDN